MPTNATNFNSGCTVSLPDISLVPPCSPCYSTSCRGWLCFREVLIASREGVLPLTSSECSFRSKARPAARDSDFKHRVFGVKTRSRGTPLLVAIVRLPAEIFIRNHFHIRNPVPLRFSCTRTSGDPTPPSPGFYSDGAGEGGNPFALSGCTPDFPLPLQPHPPESAAIHRPIAISQLLKSILQNLSG